VKGETLMKIKIDRITTASFKKYGCLIDLPRKGQSKSKNLWRIIVRQPNLGWRIAYLVVRDKKIMRLEQHPGSLESFEPVYGQGLLFVAVKKDSNSIKCFLLDKPIVLKKGVWHGIVSKTSECDVKITENSTVKCVYWKLGFELK
jgi:ureidoglycolate hydrolase